MLRLYDYLESGNGYKVRLLLHQLGKPFERVEMDITQGETRTSEFLSRNPNGRIPLLELPDGSHLAESNAICFYLAEGTSLLPSDALGRARVLQWMFFEQYSHEPNIAVLRFQAHTGTLDPAHPVAKEKHQKGLDALAVMESHLESREFFVADTYSIADIALYAYTHVADEGGFELAAYANLRRWLERVHAQANHVPITQSEGL
jgi:glutathione S-transferase